MALLTYRLGFPPSVNHYYRTVRRKVRGKNLPTVLLTDRARDYRHEVLESVLRQGRPDRPWAGSISVRVVARPPDRRIRDIDNLWKGIADSLRFSVVIEDDRYIDHLEITRAKPTPEGELIVTIERRSE